MSETEIADLAGTSGKPAEEFTVYDELGAGIGNLIAVSEGREAAQPFHPNDKPIDAYNAAILDSVNVMITDLGTQRGRAATKAAQFDNFCAGKQEIRD